MFKWLSTILPKRGHKDIPASDPNPPLAPSEGLPSGTEIPKLPKRIGPFEYHLKQRRNNPLFPEDRRTVNPQEWEEAKVYDEARVKQFDNTFSTLFVDYTLEWGSDSQKQKFAKGTMADVIEYLIDFREKWDSMLADFVFVNGTDGWNASEDQLFGILLKWRENIATTAKHALLSVGNESAIKTFEEWEDKKKRDSCWRFSHFYQMISRDCFFLSKEGDLWPRLFSESDAELEAFLAFSESDGSVRRDAIIGLLRAYHQCQAMMKAMPLDPTEDSWTQVQRNLGLVGGLVAKGEILGTWKKEGENLVFSPEVNNLLESLKKP